MQERSPRSVQRRLKRGADIVVGSVALLILSPIGLIVAMLVRIRMGRPVLFRQERLGLEGEEFELLKFRTMTEARDADGNLLSDDERITRLGNILRSTSLDELPEVINVLRGEMSLVGPRPLLPRYRQRYSAEQWRRHEVPPGMAGPVMAKGRNALSWEDKFKLDVWYVDNWSLWLDVKIFVGSLVRAISREGASPEDRATMEEFRHD